MDISDLNIPNHIAVIMDGNNRWAKKRLLPTISGHKAGSEAIITLIKSAIEFKVKYLTIYAFSVENWQRPKKEVNDLMDLLHDYLERKIDKIIENGVKIVVIGDLSKVEESIKSKIKNIEERTKNNNKIVLNVAFDYGARQEIVSAMKQIVLDIENKEINFEEINEDLISKNLYNSETPDPDLLIRTSGEMRLSNFLLWQLAYSELYFTEKLWPDFNKEDLYKAILDFNKRKRRYGKR